MDHTAIWVGVGIVIGAAAAILVGRLRRRERGGLGPMPAPPREAPDRSIAALLGTPAEVDDAEVATLRQNLRLKVMYDEAKIDRLIEFERAQAPHAGLA